MKLLLPIRKGLWIAGFILAANLAEAQIATLNFTVTQPSALVANAAANDTIFLCAGDTIAIGGAPSASGGTSPYSYDWTPTAELDAPTTANPNATPTATSTYTLVVTDANNCESSDQVVVQVDSCLGIADLEGLATFNLYPNPNNGAFEIQVSLLSAARLAKISITSLTGQTIFTKEWTHPTGMLNVPVNFTSLSKGIYVVTLDIDETRASRRVVLQ